MGFEILEDKRERLRDENHANEVLPQRYLLSSPSILQMNENIQAEFRVTGLYPIHPNTIQAEHYIEQQSSSTSRGSP